jgi:dATP pyrophosphohydrolase
MFLPDVMEKYKAPISVLVVVYTPDLQVLLLERTDHPGYWQSITGSQNQGEELLQKAARETAEEKGIDTANFSLIDLNFINKYKIFQEWRWRYAPGVTHNTEHVFSLLLPKPAPVIVSPREHLRYAWFPQQEAIEKVFSSSNAEAIRNLSSSVRTNKK